MVVATQTKRIGDIMLAGISGLINKVKGSLARKFTSAAASALTAVVLTAASGPAAADTLLVEAGPRPVPTNNMNIGLNFRVTTSDPGVTTQFATEFYEPGTVFGTMIETGGGNNITFIESPTILSTGSQQLTNISVSRNDFKDVNATTTLLGNSFQGVSMINADVLVGNPPPTIGYMNAGIFIGSYVLEPVLDENGLDTGVIFRRYSTGALMKWDIPAGQSITFSGNVDLNSQNNCLTKCLSGGGVVLGLGTLNNFNDVFINITEQSYDLINSSTNFQETYTNNGPSTQTLYGTFGAAGQAFIEIGAVLAPGGLGINTDVYQLSPVPELSTYALMGAGLLAVGAAADRRRRKADFKLSVGGD